MADMEVDKVADIVADIDIDINILKWKYNLVR